MSDHCVHSHRTYYLLHFNYRVASRTVTFEMGPSIKKYKECAALRSCSLHPNEQPRTASARWISMEKILVDTFSLARYVCLFQGNEMLLVTLSLHILLTCTISSGLGWIMCGSHQSRRNDDY